MRLTIHYTFTPTQLLSSLLQHTTSAVGHKSALVRVCTMMHDQMPTRSSTHLFRYLSDYRVLICLCCNHAVPPANLRNHIRTHHRKNGGKSAQEWVRTTVKDLSHCDLLDPTCETVRSPLPTDPPIPDLPVFDGHTCVICSFTVRQLSSMEKHYRQAHPSGRKPGRPPACAQSLLSDSPRWISTKCQRFFVQGPQSAYFRASERRDINQKSTSHQSPTKPPEQPSVGDRMLEHVLAKLAAAEEQLEWTADIVSSSQSRTEVSPWLEMTQWSRYSQGHKLSRVAPLASLPIPGAEPLLEVFVASLDRLVDQKRESLSQQRVNVFDQALIKRVFPEYEKHRTPALSPLFTLQRKTYRKYTGIWARLICFAYRIAQPQDKSNPLLPVLTHRMTETQASNLQRLISLGCQLLDLQTPLGGSHVAAYEQTQNELDRACLFFCVSLIDHTLKGDLFESVVVGFLAVSGIDAKKQIFKSPGDFTPLLSGLIKIGQMLVMQRSVVAVDDGEISSPSEILHEMHSRLLTGLSPAPLGRAIWLRAYGKKMKNAMTVAGHIRWSEDGSQVWYKEATSVRMEHFKAFIHLQVGKAWEQLDELLMLEPDKPMKVARPGLSVRNLKDDTTNREPGWNFLHLPINKDHLGDGSRWLLLRVLNSATLRETFYRTETNCAETLKWSMETANAYLDRVDAFLERLLLLVHVTCGQPARGTGLLALCHSNGRLGSHRNIFIEQGLVGTVTAYHKSYSTTGSTKIIHRYLPAPVGDILVYYLWLVQPFCQQLKLLALHDTGVPSPYLWPSGQSSWSATRLSKILERESSIHMDTKLNTSIYRHVAIAMSRAHLPGGSFKRKYPIEQRVLDRQAAHSSWQAALTYARQVGDCDGHVEQRREQYRKASCEWHRFFGFEGSAMAPRKRPLSDLVSVTEVSNKRAKGMPPSMISVIRGMGDSYASESDSADRDSTL